MGYVSDFVCHNANNPGTSSTVTLGSVATGPFRSFATAGYTTGADVYFTLADASKSETCVGVYDNTAGTVTRATVLANTSGTTSRLNFTGECVVFSFCPADKLAVFDKNNDLTVGRNILRDGLPVFPGYLAGLNLSNNGGTPNTILNTSAGVCSDSTNATLISLPAFTKTTGTPFVAGSGNAGMGVGLTVTANTWYHVHAIIRSGAPDVYFDTSVSAANAPAGTTAYRRIGSVFVNASVQILRFYQFGDDFYWAADLNSVSVSNLSTTPTAYGVSVPPGVRVVAHLRGAASAPSGFVVTIYEDFKTSAVGASLTALATVSAAGHFLIMTNTSQQVVAVSSVASTTFSLTVTGWTDTRGKT